MPSYDELKRPATGFKALYYGLLRGALRRFGPASDGIATGLNFGFDSGVMLEYVYRNTPSGKGVFGRWLDKQFLAAAGWRGIRERGDILKMMLYELLQTRQDRGVPTRLLDVACGGGRYVLEVLRDAPTANVHATLRDYAPINVQKAKELAASLGVSATIEVGDAFSEADLGALQPPPNLIIVSGLHEILPDDALIENHFKQLAHILTAGDTLIYTVQPYHPQLELIARTLNAHAGGMWVMRIRPGELIESWAQAAGFEIERVEMDSTGIFGVVQARKVG